MVQEFWGTDGPWVLQPICYQGRTSGILNELQRNAQNSFSRRLGHLEAKIISL
jgi:hypothetical protein